MRLPMKGILVAVLALMASGCVVRTRATRVVSTTTCDPNYPCANTYYWDQWRTCYVYYDGYRYYDALGTPGTYPLPPSTVIVTYPPRTYAPPSYYVPPYNTYAPPRGYVPPPQNYHTAIPVQWHSRPPSYGNTGGNSYVPPPPSYGNNGNYVPPPPSYGNTGGNRAPPPPPSSGGNYGYVPPPPSGSNGTARPPPPPPSSGGYVGSG